MCILKYSMRKKLDDYYQSTTPEHMKFGDRTYITLELLNQARRTYAETRELVNLSTKRTRKTPYQRLAATKSKYVYDDAVYCAAHGLEQIMSKYNVGRERAYQLKHYLTRKFGVSLYTK